MTEQDWAKEPWKSDNGHITDAEGGYVGYLTDFLGPEQSRSLACVNACAGVPTEDLLIMANGHLIQCKHCGYEFRLSFPPLDWHSDGLLVKCRNCGKESDFPKAEWPTNKEDTDG